MKIFTPRETLRPLKRKKRHDINRIIIRHGLNSDFYKTHNKNCINYFCFNKLREIILALFIILIILIIIIFFFCCRKKKEKFNKEFQSAKLIKNETVYKVGYFIPIDNVLSYKKCSVENCKKCYGNSYNDTCISCLNSSYDPIIDENSKIISCKFNPQKENVPNITLEESDYIILTYNIAENESRLIIEKITENILEHKSELITENITNTLNVTKCELIEENITSNNNTTKSELILENITSNINISKSMVTERFINISSENETLFDDQVIFTDDVFKNPTNLIRNKIIKTSLINMTSENLFLDCEPGFYFPEENNIENECQPCSTLGCEKCHGNSTIDFCDSCFDDYLPNYINNSLICTFELDENCIDYDNITFECFKCKNDYVLYKRKCYAYSFEAVYFTNEENQEIQLINLDKNYIEKIIIDDEIVNASKPYTNITIKKEGNHKAYFFIINNPTSFSYLFYDCKNLLSVYFTTHIKTSNITNLSNMFGFCSALISIDITNLDTYNVNNMDYMFYNCNNLTSIYLNKLNIYNVETMSGMFMNCYSLKFLNSSNFYYNNVTTFSFMFHNCLSLTSLNLNFIQNDSETKLKYINNMFSNCEKLISIDLSGFDLSNVENMESMFSGCSSLTYVNFNNTSKNNIIYMNSLFSGCSSLTSVIFDSFNTEKVINMSNMFYNCSSITNLNLNSFNTSQVKYMDEMFYGCSNLVNLYILNFVQDSLLSYNNMFKYVNSSIAIHTNNEFYQNLSDLVMN